MPTERADRRDGEREAGQVRRASGVEGLVVVEFHEARDSTLVVVRGEVDAHSLPVVEAGLRRVEYEVSRDEVVLDLGELDFVDAGGLAELARFAQRLGDEGRRVSIRRAPRNVLKLLEVSDLDRHFDLEAGAG